MWIIVDGYNVLKTVHEAILISEKEQTAFINLLGRYIKKRDHKICVVFDGGPCMYPMHTKQKGIKVIYSGEFKTADDVIIAFVQEHRTKQLVVITADKELSNQTKASGADSIDPLVFYQRVRDLFIARAVQHHAKGIIKKLHNDTNEEVDEIMHKAAAMKSPKKDDMNTIFIPTKKHKVSKKERRYQRLLEKL